jgi:uncharacterized protein YjaZ
MMFVDTDDYQFDSETRELIQRIVDVAIDDFRTVFTPSRFLHVVIKTDRALPEKLDVGGIADGNNLITLRVNPWRGNFHQILNRKLRPRMFHELNHLVRHGLENSNGPLKSLVAEGLATACERDLCGSEPAWGEYDPEAIRGWAVDFIEAAGLPGFNRGHWFFLHPDGRHWIAYRVGTYIIDTVRQKHDLTLSDLMKIPSVEILALAELVALD